MHSFRMVYDFNVEVQFDILFYKSILEPGRGLLNIVHLIDVCIRFTVARIVNSKEDIELTRAIAAAWIAYFGEMQSLVPDNDRYAWPMQFRLGSLERH